MGLTVGQVNGRQVDIIDFFTDGALVDWMGNSNGAFDGISFDTLG